MNNPNWCSARTIYRHNRVVGGNPKTVFEEHVVLLQAADFDDARAKADAEAAGYCGAPTDVVYLGFVDVRELFDETVGSGTEVCPLMRDSELGDQEYLDHFINDGKERWRMRREQDR